MKTKKENPRGFTLVEVLVVVATLGLLGSILLATFSGVRDRTLNVAVLQQNSEYAKAIMSYSTDNNDKFPPSSGGVYVDDGLTSTLNDKFLCMGSGCIFKNIEVNSSIAVKPRIRPSNLAAGVLSNYISGGNTSNRLFTINNLDYKGTVYQCVLESNSECSSAFIFYPLSGTICPPQASVYVTDNTNVVCRQTIESALSFAGFEQDRNIQDNNQPPPTDGDGDGVNDDVDNCPTSSNAYQEDADGNGIGDACEVPGCKGAVVSCTPYGQYGHYNCSQYDQPGDHRSLYCGWLDELNECVNSVSYCDAFDEYSCSNVPGCSWY